MAPKPKTGVGGRQVPGAELAEDPTAALGRRARRRARNNDNNNQQQPDNSTASASNDAKQAAQTSTTSQPSNSSTGAISANPPAAASSSANPVTQPSVSSDNANPGTEDNSIQRLCTPPDSHRNRNVKIAMGPKQPVDTSKAIETETHGQIGLGGNKLRQINASRNNHSGRQFHYHELRPGIVGVQQDLQILTNHFKVNLPQGIVLYEYSISGFPARASRAKCKMMVLDMIEIDPELYAARDRIATDYKKKLITLVPLQNTVQNAGVVSHSIEVNDFTAGSREMPERKNLELTFQAAHRLDGLNNYVNGDDEHYQDRGAKEALNIVIAKAVADSTSDEKSFQIGNNRFYFGPGWEDFVHKGEKGSDDIGLVAIRGYYSSIKPGMGSILLNVSNVTTAFYKAQPLQDYLHEFKTLQSWTGSNEGISEEAKKKLERHLGGLRVRVNFDRAGAGGQPADIDLEGRRVKTLSEFGKFPQKQTFRLDDSNPKKIVWKHLRGKYFDHSPEEDKMMPTANVGRKEEGKQKYYLASQLDVIAGQVYKGTLSGSATGAMIDIAKKRPEENYHAILSEGMQCLGLRQDSRLPMLGAMNIDIIPKLLQLPARKIPSPKISYAMNQTLVPAEGWWKMPEKYKFKNDGSSVTAKKVQFFRAAGGDAAHYDLSVDLFNQCHASYGAQKLVLRDSTRKYEFVKDWTPETLGHQLKKLYDSAPFDIAIMVFPSVDSKQRQNYASFKIATDQLSGLKSLGICMPKFLPHSFLKDYKGHYNQRSNAILQDFREGISSTTKVRDYVRNLSMKLNLRFGNSNHTLDSVLLKRLGNRKVMIMGADVTHPGAGSINGTPSIAAVVASVDKQFARYSGQMRLNPSRQERIENMEDMTRNLILQWSENNGNQMPQNILYYRDGVSDSQYATIREMEVDAIHSAWRGLRENPYATLRITVIVVTKRHHTRLYPMPTGDNASIGKEQEVLVNKGNTQKTNDPKPHARKSGNCMPGTVVDHTITSPYYFDFYLLSHNVPGERGTARPAHYIVLENEMGFSAKDIQDLTFELCFMYARCNCSVSYAPAAYYADKLCERGRLYLKPFLDLCNENRDYYREMADERPVEFRSKYESMFYRGGNRTNVEGAAANPWHTDLDGTMFWM